MNERRPGQEISDLRPANGKLTNEQFKQLVQYLSSKYGLRIPIEKKVLIESRLARRMSALNLKSLDEYLHYIFNGENSKDEYTLFIDHITTHKTFFFREKYQFEFLEKMLPDYMKGKTDSRISVWSAGCSTGEEVYTLGITLQECKANIPTLDYRITGTDVSIPALKSAASGFYSTELTYIPENFKNKYFQPLTNGKTGLQFHCPEITNRISLGALNLNGKQYNLPFMYDFIFCRNVIIYFDGKTRAEVLTRMVSKLKPNGYLFLGHSETALGIDLPLKNIKPTIYQKLH